MSKTCHYDILKISPDASDEDVRKAYIKLARIYHPDSNPQNPAVAQRQFLRLTDAYNALKTKPKRLKYNSFRFGEFYENHTNDNTNKDGFWQGLARMFAAPEKQCR